MKRFCLFVFAAFFSGYAFSIQEDVNAILRHPDFLFYGNQNDKINFLSAKALKAGFGVYALRDDDHAWQFKSAGDVAIVSFGQNILWRASLTIEGLADSGTSKNIEFRMRQSGYDISTALEFRHNDDDIFYVGYHHRCRHGSDHKTDQNILIPSNAALNQYDSRVLVRSGLEAGYNALFHFGSFKFVSSSIANAYLIGQNIDTSFQPRIALSSVLQTEYHFGNRVVPFVSLGLGTSWVTAGEDKTTKHYGLFTPIHDSRWRFSPAAAAGLWIPGKVGDFRMFATYTSKLDTGFGQSTREAHFALVAAEFWL